MSMRIADPQSISALAFSDLSIKAARLPASAPEGLRLLLQVLYPPQDETDLIAAIEHLADELWTHPQPRPTLPAAKRETISFRGRYHTQTRRVAEGLLLPAFLAEVRDRCARAAGLDAEMFEQATATRYPPHAGIGWHTDAAVYGPTVLSLSLATDWYMDFNCGGHRTVVRVAIPRGALIVMSGAARSIWRHCIRPVKTLRYSVSFRSIATGLKTEKLHRHRERVVP
jgi:alkylated DNA repair dioxygenase AlkB